VILSLKKAASSFHLFLSIQATAIIQESSADPSTPFQNFKNLSYARKPKTGATEI
jgi:hypothetical protein